MNPRSIDTARDPDLRFSYPALLRAAQRARQVALQTGTSLIVSRNGVVEELDPATETSPSRAQAAMLPYVAKR